MKLGASDAVEGLCTCAEGASEETVPAGCTPPWNDLSVPSKGMDELASVMKSESL